MIYRKTKSTGHYSEIILRILGTFSPAVPFDFPPEKNGFYFIYYYYFFFTGRSLLHLVVHCAVPFGGKFSLFFFLTVLLVILG